MRRKNWRVVIVGFMLAVMAVAFYFYMLSIASKSNDPVALMKTVGTVAGVVCSLSLVMIIIRADRKEALAEPSLSLRRFAQMWPATRRS